MQMKMEGRFQYPLEGPFRNESGNFPPPSFPFDDEIMRIMREKGNEMSKEFLMETIPDMKANRELKNKKQKTRETLLQFNTINRNGTSIAYNENNKKEILMANDKPWGNLPDDPNARGADGYMDSIVQNTIEEEERRKKEQENKK